jgi:FKBP-type peptidyl-prolyl cis-trans isomerase
MRLNSASVLLLSIALVILPACAKNPPPAPAAKGPPALTTEDDKTLYAMGQIISKQLEAFQLTPQELEVVKSGLDDGAKGKAGTVDPSEYGPKIQQLLAARSSKAMDKAKADGQAYLAKAATEQGATKTPSGIVVTTLAPGNGPSPAATDEVKVHYEGKLINDQVFDSSVKRGEPATFPLNGVIPCWTEALQLMKVGGKARIVCPSDAAYGDRGSMPQIPPGSTLIFEVQLLDIVKPAKPEKK